MLSHEDHETLAERSADTLDRAYEATALFEEESIRTLRQAAAKMPVGEPGECIRCEEYSMRLVNRCCARCRDKFKLP